MTMTNLQPSLFEPLPQTVQPEIPEGATIQERFERFHAANPQVYQALRQRALMVRGWGGRIGMKALFEALRWDYRVQTQGDEYKLNNVFSSRYARLLMAQETELAGFFETRVLKSA